MSLRAASIAAASAAVSLAMAHLAGPMIAGLAAAAMFFVMAAIEPPARRSLPAPARLLTPP